MTLLKKYYVNADNLRTMITIETTKEFVPMYNVAIPKISRPTSALLDEVKEELLRTTKISFEEIFDPIAVARMKEEFSLKAQTFIEKGLPGLSLPVKNILVTTLLHEMLGLGKIEVLISDGDLEEIVINSPREPVWVYHKKFGWLKTNIFVENDTQIQNYASIIARRIGRQITTLEPLLDAHLVTGDRANATLFPISTKGNTLSIRKFARKPWTITDFMENKTLSVEIAAFLWMCMQYELNIIVAGGTASGKTSLLNSLMPFIQPYQRIISIEDTRELALPDFLHWIPLTTRLPNPEGKGEVSMLDLMINSLRMRPDRMVIGEIRRADQAEVMFEAMHTGHSVYSTLHADTSEQVVRRMINPPINVPRVLLEALHLIVVQRRDRRLGTRKIYQIAELEHEEDYVKPHILYSLRPTGDVIRRKTPMHIFKTLGIHTGMNRRELMGNMREKIRILKKIRKNHVNEVNAVGRIIADYYSKNRFVG